LTTKVSYKFNLRGPSLAVQTFCSTSLVATHLACQALLNGECDMALAGGVSIIVPQVSGYRYEQGGIGSIDGHIRAFDANGSGIVFGNGLGAVVLKRLDDALADGDPVRAVIKATAINNDGAGKAGYSATSVEGQAEVVAATLEISGIDPETIGYMEAHGTGTPLGDPIEMAALNRAFRPLTDRRRFCPIGSAKTNVGHLDRAAGITGLIKTILTLENGEIPPSLHFKDPNPAIDFEDNAFYVATESIPWPKGDHPRRAGVNSLGLGGTNAHAILEEAPTIEPSAPGAPWQLLPLSARTETALERMTDRFADHLEHRPGQPLADVAYTLQIGRKAFGQRRVVVADAATTDSTDRNAETVAALRERRGQRVFSGVASDKPPRVVFLFPGLGGQYENMGRDLYEGQPVFRDTVDRAAEVLQEELGFDFREILYPAPTAAQEPPAAKDADTAPPTVNLRQMLGRGGDAKGEGEGNDSAATGRLRETAVAQPVLFVVEVALARLVQSWGVEPQAMVGYSLGEYTAACIGGMLELDDALRLVARRARMIQALEAGAMLAVPLAADAVEQRLAEEPFAGKLSLAAVNGPEQSVVAGPVAAVDAFAEALTAEGVVSRRLQTTHAFHSTMMEAIHEPFAEVLQSVTFSAPKIPWLSNVTGTWMSADEATDPTYWARHMRAPVRFSESLEKLAALDGNTVLLELGPGQTLGSLALQHPAVTAGGRPPTLAALRHDYEHRPDLAHLLETVGRLWTQGVEIDWLALHGGARRLRVALPSYSFDRQAYWVEAKVHGYTGLARLATPTDAGAEDALLHLPSWRRERAPRVLPPAVLAERLDPTLQGWLLLADPADGGVAEAVAAGLRAAGRAVFVAAPGDAFAETSEHSWTVRPGDSGDAAALLEAMGARPDAIIHLWSLAAPEDEALATGRRRGLDGLLAILRALGAEHPLALWTVAAAAHDVSGEEPIRPAAATVLAATRVVPREWPGMSCRAIDLVPPSNGSATTLGALVLAEIATAADDALVAFRGAHRWVPTLEPLSAHDAPSVLRDGGAYLLTGGLDSRGFALASYLARRGPGVRLALVQPPPGPGQETPTEREERWTRRRAALIEAGAEVLDLVAEATDPDALRTAVAETVARFGGLHGVVHGAEPSAVGAAYLTVEESASDAASTPGQALLAVRAEGARNLQAALDGVLDAPLDFALLLSSTANLTGGLGLLYDAAAGFYLDAFAAQQRDSDVSGWTSVAWDFYLDDTSDRVRSRGIPAERGGPPPAEGAACSSLPAFSQPGGSSDEVDPLAALQEATLDALFRLLPAAQLVASPGSFVGFNRLAQHTTQDAAEHREGEDTAPSGGLYPRPQLSTRFVEPRTDTERRIAAVWESMLGVSPVGMDDGFLELGGDSLLAARLVARLREEFALELPVRLFFEASTVAELAKEVETRLEARATEEQEDVNDLLAMLDDLSEEEIEAELARRAGQEVASTVD
jgi:acyl transferase domain-containing protein/acyl carrier protein